MVVTDKKYVNIKSLPPVPTYQVVASQEARDEARKEEENRKNKRAKARGRSPVKEESQSSDTTPEASPPNQPVDSNKWVELISSSPSQKKSPEKLFKTANQPPATKKLNRSL